MMPQNKWLLMSQGNVRVVTFTVGAVQLAHLKIENKKGRILNLATQR